MTLNHCKQIERCGSRLARALCAVVLALAGCELFDPLAPYYCYPGYTVSFAAFPDESDDVKWKVHLAELYMDRRGSMVQIGIAGGILQAAPSRIPDHVVMRWVNPSGVVMKQAITLTGIVPDLGHFKGTIWFLYHHDHWTAKPVTEDEAIQRAVHGPSTAPFDEVR